MALVPQEGNIARDHLLDVTVADGKYRLIQPFSGGLKALRHIEEWRDLCGDGLIFSLGCEIARLRSFINELTLCDGGDAASVEILAGRIRNFAQRAQAGGEL